MPEDSKVSKASKNRRKVETSSLLDGENNISPAAYRQAVDRNNLFDVGRGVTLGRTKAHSLREKQPEPRHRLTGKTVEQIAKQLRYIASDPVELAAFMSDSRRPPNADKARWGIAQRAAAGIPMLNADPRQVREALDRPKRAGRIISSGIYASVIVKPVKLEAAKIGRASAYWGERVWNVHRPKYSAGFFITDDFGNQSMLLRSMGEVYSAIRKAGFELIRR